MAAPYPEIASETRSKLSQNRCSLARQRAPRRRVLEPEKSRLRHQITTALGQPLVGHRRRRSEDRDGGLELLAILFGLFPFLRKLLADSAYQGPIFHGSWPASCPTSRPRSSSDPIGSRAPSSSPGIGWSNAPSLAQPLPPIGQGLGKPRSPSSSSPQSASSSKNSVILHKVSRRSLS